MRTTRSIALVLVLFGATLLPFAQADGWKHRGTNEPDTAYDVHDQMMFLTADTDPDPSVKKVYFNAQRIVIFTSYNPNVAATGSRHLTPGDTSFTAMLGIWKDCNGDGYVGNSEYGLQEYRTELLLDDSICGAKAVPTCSAALGTAPCPGYLYPHNDGVWVRELIYIGDRASAATGGPIPANPTYFAAPGTTMWGHFGVPGAAPATVCPISGGYSTRSTGYMVRYADCHLGHKGTATLNQVQDDTGLPVGGWDQTNIPGSKDAFLNQDIFLHTVIWGANGDGHASYDPDTGERRDGGLYARDNKSMGHDGRADRAFGVWDCQSTQTVSDPTGGALSGRKGVKEPDQMPTDPTSPGQHIVPSPIRDRDGYIGGQYEVFDANGHRRVIGPSIHVGDPTRHSYYEPLNETYNIATVGKCEHTSASSSHGLYYLNIDGSRSNTNAIEGRQRADLSFIFSAGARRNDQSAILGRNWPLDLGLAPNRDLDTIGSSWRENQGFVTLPQVVNGRTDLSPAVANYMTFYVKLGDLVLQHGLQVPTNGLTFTFGIEACPSIGSGAPNSNGWVCDPAPWTARCIEDGRALQTCPLVGETYHMRDIDCEDGALVRDLEAGGVGVYASGVLLTQQGCAGPNDPRP